jgi:hypothetical protein
MGQHENTSVTAPIEPLHYHRHAGTHSLLTIFPQVLGYDIKPYTMIKENRKQLLLKGRRTTNHTAATAAEMKRIMKLVAAALNMDMDNYYSGRTRAHADLRCITCYLIKLLYPHTQSIDAANATGLGRSVINYHTSRAHNYIDTNERTFLKKLITVIKTLSNDQNKNKAQDNYGPQRPGSPDVCLPNRRRANAGANDR